MNTLIQNIIRAVAELPDRTSPSEFPNAMLVTAEELEEILLAHGAISQTEMKLDQPAQIGGATFREGVRWETVINAAKRHYRHNKSQEKSKPIVSPSQLMQIALGDLLLVPKTPSEACLCSMAMRYRHDFGLLDQVMQESCLITMRQLYEEATGQGFYKLGSEERKSLVDGLGTRHPYFERLINMDKVILKVSPEEAEKLKKDLEDARKNGHFRVMPSYGTCTDAIDAFNQAAFENIDTSNHSSDNEEPKNGS